MKNFKLLKLIWAPITILLLHEICASIMDHHKVDPIFHFLGGTAAAYFFFQVLNRWISNATLGQRLLFTFALSCTAFLLWEVAEFLSDKFFRTTVQISVSETMMDIILGMSGAILFLIIVYFFEQKKST